MRTWQWKICYAIGRNPYCCNQAWNHFAEIFCTVRAELTSVSPPLARRVRPLETEPPSFIARKSECKGKYLLVLTLHLWKLWLLSEMGACPDACRVSVLLITHLVWDSCFSDVFFLWSLKFKTLGSFE